MSVWSSSSSSSWRQGIRNTDEMTVLKEKMWQFSSSYCIIMCSSPWWLVWSIRLHIALRSRRPKPLFYGQMRTYHSITFQVDTLLSCVTRGFSHFERAGDFLFFEDQVELSLKREFGSDREKGVGGEKKIKWRLKRSEWWRSHKIWQDRFHQLKSFLKKS